ncbi:unnamed protein product [Ambrosiozyma monospora]|uniref:Unnamed protein product n=1 Tax=Ambrosiozyma monospora TaxID=43982 RepID=A0ACB5STF6_AMBMO|nr:unnamed protein product [Ambrosiozyma monospora]
MPGITAELLTNVIEKRGGTPTLHEVAQSKRRRVNAALARRPQPSPQPQSMLDSDDSNDDFTKNKEEYDKDLKLLCENKFDTRNSWNTPVINYFCDMRVLKSGDSNKINFELATATLDGSVKVLNHRIDSVSVDTARLMSVLDGKNYNHPNSFNRDSDDEDDEYIPEEGGRKKKSSKKQERATLYDGFDRIRLKRDTDFERNSDSKASEMDRELNINPLFRKMLTEFDEGGAKSLLMNSLKLDKDSQVTFVDPDTFDVPNCSFCNPVSKEPEAPKESTIQPELNSMISSILDKNIFTNSDDLISNDIGMLYDTLSGKDVELDEAFDNLADDDDDNNMNNDIPDYGWDGFDDPGFSDTDDANEGNQAASLPQDEYEELNPAGIKAIEKAEMARYKDIDSLLKDRWDGNRGHWKIKRLKRKHTPQDVPETEETSSSTSKSAGADIKSKGKRKKKEDEELIDFMDESLDVDEDVLFAKPSEKRKIQLPGNGSQLNRDITTLPDDLEWNSEKLIRKFMKPNQTVIGRKRIKKRQVANIEADGEFWAGVYENDYAPEDNPNFENIDDFNPINVDAGDDNDDYQDEDFYGDDGDEFGFEIPTQMLGTQATQSIYDIKRSIKYSKVSKRVNVKLLKNNLWRSVTSAANDEHQVKTRLSNLIKLTETNYQGKRKSELSTSFYLICVLHLANEHGLVLSNNDGDDLSDLKITGEIVDLEELEKEQEEAHAKIEKKSAI